MSHPASPERSETADESDGRMVDEGAGDGRATDVRASDDGAGGDRTTRDGAIPSVARNRFQVERRFAP